MNIHKLLFRLMLGRRLPTTRGELIMPGIRSQVLIRRDRYGVPYIEAETDDDAWYALGFCQGQDRSFSLEMLLRAAHGTLCELVGPGALATDQLSRRLGFARLAPIQLDVFHPRYQGALRGVRYTALTMAFLVVEVASPTSSRCCVPNPQNSRL